MDVTICPVQYRLAPHVGDLCRCCARVCPDRRRMWCGHLAPDFLLCRGSIATGCLIPRVPSNRPKRAARQTARVDAVRVKGYPYAFHIALDGNGINGLEGMAGVCLLLFDPIDNRYAYKIVYYDGVAGGHAVSVNPAGTVGYLAMPGQHLLFYDAHTLSGNRPHLHPALRNRAHLAARQHPRRLAVGQRNRHRDRRRISTHSGSVIWKATASRATWRETAARHEADRDPAVISCTARWTILPMARRVRRGMSASGTARTTRSRCCDCPRPVWHVAVHPKEDIFYAVSFRVTPQDYQRLPRLGDGILKEYAFRDRCPAEACAPPLGSRAQESRTHQLRHRRYPTAS